MKLYLPWCSLVMTASYVDSLVWSNMGMFLQWRHSRGFYPPCVHFHSTCRQLKPLRLPHPVKFYQTQITGSKKYLGQWLEQATWSNKLPFLGKLGYQPSNGVKKKNASKKDLNTGRKEGGRERKVKLLWTENITALWLQCSHTLKGPTSEKHTGENTLQEMVRPLAKIIRGEIIWIHLITRHLM